MVLTLDALHITRKTARLITDQLHAHYVLILKGNQPLARKAARALLKGTDTKFEETTAAEDDQGHARTGARPCAPHRPTAPCFQVPTRSSACAATSAASTASGPVRKSSSASPACPPTSPAPNTSTGTRGNTGQWRTGCTGYAM